MSLEKQILERKTRQIAEDIDFGILAGILKEQGWTMIEVPMNFGNIASIATATRLKENLPRMIEWCHDQRIVYKTFGGSTWLFRDEQDSVAFILRWL